VNVVGLIATMNLCRFGAALSSGRRSPPASSPRIEYELTDKGEALLPIIDAMRNFGPRPRGACTPLASEAIAASLSDA